MDEGLMIICSRGSLSCTAGKRKREDFNTS